MPEGDILNAEIEALLLDTGLFADVALERVLGKRHIASESRWQVVACFRFLAGEGEATSCDDSFRLMRLDSGTWIVSVDMVDVYRWREVRGLAGSPENLALSSDGA